MSVCTEDRDTLTANQLLRLLSFSEERPQKTCNGHNPQALKKGELHALLPSSQKPQTIVHNS